MKFTKVIFRNWIGFQLGLGINEFELDFTKTQHRLCLVAGTNGSGKSTLLEGLTLFTDIYSNIRDSNDFIIVDENGNKDGSRDIYFTHNGEYYLSKVHWLTDKTRCYLFRTTEDGTQIEDLNPAGNVRTYEEQLELRFNLTKDTGRLLFLGPGLKDIITMTPGDRKNSISKFTPNIDKYLELHKQSGKYHSKLKSDISVVTSEIGRLGNDRDRIVSHRDAVKMKYDTSLDKIQMMKSVESTVLKTIDMLQINGVPVTTLQEAQIQEYNNTCRILTNNNNLFNQLCVKLSLSTGLSESYYNELLLETRDEYTKFKYASASFEDRKQKLLESQSSIYNLLESQRAMYDQYVKENNPEKFINAERALYAESLEIQETLESMLYNLPALKDINNILFTKDDATKYIIFIDNLMGKLEIIQSLYSEYSILEDYLNGSQRNHDIESIISQENSIIASLQTQKDELISKLSKYDSNKDLSDLLKQIPSDCKNDMCPFIQKAKIMVELEDTGSVRKQILLLDSEINNHKEIIKESEDVADKTMNFLREIQQLNSFINNYIHLISKFPDHVLITDMRQLFRNTSFLVPRARIYSEYSYLKDRQDDVLNKIVEIRDSIEKAASYHTNVAKQEESIKNTSDSLSKIENELKQLINENQLITVQDMQYRNKLSDLQNLIDIRTSVVNGLRKYDTYKKNIRKLKKHYISSLYFTDRLKELRQKISYLTDDLKQYETELNSAEYNLRRYDEFIIQRDKLQQEFELLDVLRKCWSSTTGIPLIFIEGFMNQLLFDANNYLCQIWDNREFLISGFNIDEKNFYILINRGDEFICKDASQCSGAERAMLCTVLSLALLKQLPHVENMFNIAKFDEIDGTLDYDKRRVFLGILTDLLDDIGAEQAFVISHSDTFQSDVDVILLKGSDEYEERLLNGNQYNVIYRY